MYRIRSTLPPADAIRSMDVAIIHTTEVNMAKHFSAIFANGQVPKCRISNFPRFKKKLKRNLSFDCSF